MDLHTKFDDSMFARDGLKRNDEDYFATSTSLAMNHNYGSAAATPYSHRRQYSSFGSSDLSNISEPVTPPERSGQSYNAATSSNMAFPSTGTVSGAANHLFSSQQAVTPVSNYYHSSFRNKFSHSHSFSMSSDQGISSIFPSVIGHPSLAPAPVPIAATTSSGNNTNAGNNSTGGPTTGNHINDDKTLVMDMAGLKLNHANGVGGPIRYGETTPPHAATNIDNNAANSFLQADTTDDKFPILIRRESSGTLHPRPSFGSMNSISSLMGSNGVMTGNAMEQAMLDPSPLDYSNNYIAAPGPGLIPGPNRGHGMGATFHTGSTPPVSNGAYQNYFVPSRNDDSGSHGGFNKPVGVNSLKASPPASISEARTSAGIENSVNSTNGTCANTNTSVNTTNTCSVTNGGRRHSSGPNNGHVNARRNRRWGSNGSSHATEEAGNGGGHHHSNSTGSLNLETMTNEVYGLCKDQHGCRFLQKKLEEDNPAHLEIIYKETLPHVVELMTDPFGNYLCQKLFEHANEKQRTELVRNASSELIRVALNQHGTRALQKMIEYVDSPEQVTLIVDALSSNVVKLIKDLNGNHVVQKCLNRLGPDGAQFIFDAVCENCVEVGTHRHGCCVLQRCIDYASPRQRVQLVDVIIENALVLVQDPFGNYVTQYVLDLNEDEFSQRLMTRFSGSICALSMQKFSSNVIEKCLRIAQRDMVRSFVSEIVESSHLDRLLRDSYANYVIQTALDYGDLDIRRALVDNIRPIIPSIRSTPYGRRIQTKIAAPDYR